MDDSPNILFLHDGSKLFDELQKYGYKLSSIYSKQPLIMRIMRRLHLKFRLPYSDLWHASWKHDVGMYDIIILLDTILDAEIISFIRSKNPHCKFIFWRLNIVNAITKPSQYPKALCSEWSFDKDDCDCYGFNHTPTSSVFFHICNPPAVNIEYDVFFLGKDKGRLEQISQIKSRFDKLRLRTYFYVVKDRWKLYNKNDILHGRGMTYEKSVLNVAKSRAILDIVQQGQVGFTLRAMESVFFNKKLITNNHTIVNADFYNPNNIFILGVDDENGLVNFVNSEYEPVQTDTLEKYKLINVVQYMIENTADNI